MNADKRSVSTDALATLGCIIDSTQKRDAIHLAVEPVVAGEKLYPGQDIGIENGRATTKATKKLGIVDPFLIGYVPEGEMFWLIVYPRQITSLRHVWAHPDFDEVPKKDIETEFEKSQKWIENYAASIPLSYDVLMRGADDKVEFDDYLCFGSLLDGEYVTEEFWDHYEIVRQTKVVGDRRGNFFTCSC